MTADRCLECCPHAKVNAGPGCSTCDYTHARHLEVRDWIRQTRKDQKREQDRMRQAEESKGDPGDPGDPGARES